jgi:hypothetical protein
MQKPEIEIGMHEMCMRVSMAFTRINPVCRQQIHKVPENIIPTMIENEYIGAKYGGSRLQSKLLRRQTAGGLGFKTNSDKRVARGNLDQ